MSAAKKECDTLYVEYELHKVPYLYVRAGEETLERKNVLELGVRKP